MIWTQPARLTSDGFAGFLQDASALGNEDHHKICF